MQIPDELYEQRRQLSNRFAPVAMAWSTDGRTAGLSGPLDLGLAVGGFAVVEADPDDDGPDAVLHVRALQVLERELISLAFDAEDGELGRGFTAATLRPMIHVLAGTGAVLGRIREGSVEIPAPPMPFGEHRVRPARGDEVRAILDALDAGAPTVEIGTVDTGDPTLPTAPARLRAGGFARHTFMCGQSGSGKTYTTGVLFERLLGRTSLPMVVLDPNSDHVHLGVVDGDDDSAAAQRHRAVAGGVRTARARGAADASYTLCADFCELDVDGQARLLRIDPIADLDLFAALRDLHQHHPGVRTIWEFAEVAATEPAAAPLATRIANLGLDRWTLWRREGEASIITADLAAQRCVVFDLGSLPTPQERSIVALTLLQARWARRHQRQPVLIAVDEAHNVLPATTTDPILAAAADVGVLIAGEGRKFGLHLFVATQRPGKVHPNVVTQCDNLVLMRMNGEADIAVLESMFSHVPPALLHEAVAFGLGQALLAGPIAPLARIVRVGRRVTREGGGDVPTDWVADPLDLPV